ncbi:hypothetical protein X801_05802 [Opisthorchis viverrini]|uniref:Zinc knuckle n=1 Tax=Opisthorchis viverrini TaxID=6198 RepID=A0A1S8WV54_OPIVI|nr:hypothetical protein X801_05802 [Opisthorchis viverrini]
MERRYSQTVCNQCKGNGHFEKVCQSAPMFKTDFAVTNQLTRTEILEYALHATSPTTAFNRHIKKNYSWVWVKNHSKAGTNGEG